MRYLRVHIYIGLGLILAAGIIGGYAWAQQVLNPSPVALVCAFTTTPPTVTTGKFVYVQCDTSGYLLTKAAP